MGMPAKVKTALRTLLLSTADVCGTEGRKTKLRYNGRADNLFFGAPSFFETLNFKDTQNPLVWKLHVGPHRHAHFGAGRRSSAADAPELLGDPFLASAEPKMPALHDMHKAIAAKTFARAEFFLLMSSLHYRWVIGVERLHIGCAQLARPRRPPHDNFADSLQPCVSPGTTDVPSPSESQARGFLHGHGKGHSILGPSLHWLLPNLDKPCLQRR